MNLEKIANLIKNLRKKSGLTQSEFAEKYHVSYQAVSKWENAKSIPDIAILKQICEDYNISLDTLTKHKKSNKTVIISAALVILTILASFIIHHFKSEDFIFSVNTNQDKDKQCVIGECSTSGSVSVSETELLEHPEYLGNSGSMSWNLTYNRAIGFERGFLSKELNWVVPGMKTEFSGTIIYNGEEFNVTAKRSFGYYDKNWGRDFTSPFFHLGSSFLTSQISGKLLDGSAFAVQGEYNGTLTVLISLEGNIIEFHAEKGKKYNVIYDCQEITDDDMGAKLHWSCSVSNKKYVIDIDVYCRTKDLFLRDYESPMGERKVMRILSSGTGVGKFKLYKVVKKSLELVEQAEVSKCVCEYGNLEKSEE